MLVDPTRRSAHERALRLSFTLAIAAGLAGQAHAQAPLRVVASAGVAGEFARPICEEGQTLETLPFARTARALTARRAQGDIVIDTGGLFARHGVTRFTSRENPDALAALSEALGYHALAVSEADLGDPRDSLVARARALRERGIPMVASNLRCDESADALCDVLWTAADGVPTINGVAILSFIEPAALGRVGPASRRGLRLLPLATSVRRLVTAARERGAETVIAIIDSGRGAQAIAHASAAMREIPAAERPDIVFSSDAGSELLFARPADVRPGFVAAPPRGAVNLDVRRTGARYDLLATPIEGVDAGAVDAVGDFIESVGPAYCEHWGSPLAGGTLQREMNATDLVGLSASVMREATGADVAILNRYAIDERWARDEGVLSNSDVQIGIQYDENLVVGLVRGSWLRILARRADPALEVPGLVISNVGTSRELLKLHGRTVVDIAEYKVVTIGFLATGGDEALPAFDGWEPPDESITLRGVVGEYLAEAREEDPRDALDDPSTAMEWTSNISTALTFTGSAVRDGGEYAEGPLTNQGQVLVGLQLNMQLNGASRLAAWSNELAAQYSLASTRETDGFDEGSDQITYRTSAQYRGFRASVDELYVPDLILEGFLRTEFSKPDERDNHFLNLRFVAGPQWRFHRYVSFRAVGGVEIIEATSSALRRVEPGVGAQLNITPWVLMRVGLRSLQIGMTLDYFASGFGGEVRHLLQGALETQLNLSRTVGLGFSLSLYGLQEAEGPFSFALGTSANLQVGWGTRWLSN
ncbi:MAG: 5'-nucleotidase C-terminal domain-containing protein [Polyangiales bacterium]